MTNAELIKALRCEKDCDDCAYHTDNAWSRCDELGMRCDAADELEAADKRIAELNTKCADLQSQINSMENEIEELIPKDGEWLDEQRGRWIYAKCNLCGKVQDVRSNYCPNCGAKMKGEQE